MKKLLSTILIAPVILLCALLSGNNAFANHLVGMDLNYTWVSGNTYKITLVAYGNCGSVSETVAFDSLYTAQPLICIYNGGTYQESIRLSIQSPIGVEITPVCPADSLNTQCHNLSSATPGIRRFIYSATYTFPSESSHWRIIFPGSMNASGTITAGRATSITNILAPGGGPTTTELIDTLNNTINDHHNSSPDLTVLPTPFFCDNSADNYNPGAVDPDEDSLSFFLVPGWAGTDNCAPLTTSRVTYLAGFSATAPMTATSFAFNQATGQISFFPSALQRSLVVYNIEEYRKGPTGDTLVGTSQREMTFLVITCTNTSPTATIDSATGDGTINTLDSTDFYICANSGPFSISLDPHEPDTSNLITVAATGLPAGATLTVTGDNTNHPHAVVSWTSTGVTYGNYTFYLTFSDNNCPLTGQQTIAYTIGIYPIPSLSAVITSAATCRDSAQILFTPTGQGSPFTIVIAPTDTIASRDSVSFYNNLAVGTYSITTYSAFATQCSANSTLVVPGPQLDPTDIVTNPDYCGNNDGSIKLLNLNAGATDQVSFQFNGVWQTPESLTIGPDSSTIIQNLCAGVYDSIIVSYYNCASAPSGPLTLINPPFLPLRLSELNPTACGFSDGKIMIMGVHPNQSDTVNYSVGGVAQPPFTTFVGDDSMITLSGLIAGTYSNIIVSTPGVCNATAPSACISTVLGPVTLVAPYISPGFTTAIHYGCSADTVLFTNTSSAPGSPVVHYTWSFGDGSVADTDSNPVHVFLNPHSTTAVTYTVSMTLNNGGCDSTITQVITLDNFISAHFTAPDFVCQDNSVTFTNSSSGTAPSYTWYFGDGSTSTATAPSHTYANSGNYTVMLVATNFVPCTDTATELLAVDSSSLPLVYITDSAICEGHAVTLTGIYPSVGVTNVTWSFGDGSMQENVNPVVHAYDTTGYLTVTLHVTNRACPSGTGIGHILIVPSPAIDLGADTSICPGSTAIILIDANNFGRSGASWLWSTGATTPSLAVTSPGTYYATVTMNGCEASDSVIVANACYIDIPNVFTPNNDGTNDYFFPRQFLTRGLTTFSMNIYNRWGQQVFATTTLDGRGWDGKFNNIAQPDGVYIYVIDGTFKDGQKEHRQGNVTLLR
jgi:gliding motility-associated-like protein